MHTFTHVYQVKKQATKEKNNCITIVESINKQIISKQTII